MNTPKIPADKYKDLQLFAWIGEDELGSGEVGIKAGFVPAGCIPLVAKDQHKMEPLLEQMQAQANMYGKTIRLCRYQFIEEIITVKPNNE